VATASIKKAKPVEYPTTDGKPLAETDFHCFLLNTLRQMLEFKFTADPMVYVSGNLLMYYVRGNKRMHVAPDVFVVKGVSKKKRMHFLTWEEGKTPNAVIEITSKSTRKEDTGKKFLLYRDVLKVREYFLFDPFGDYLKPDRLRGYRLRKGEYVPITLVEGRMPSLTLGVHLEAVGEMLRLYDPETNAWLPTDVERVEQKANRADEETKRAEEEAKRADEEAKRADEEAKRADEEAKRADEEAKRADESERAKAALIEENDRLRRLLEFKKNGH
jgi:Uma2 family endonuclease